MASAAYEEKADASPPNEFEQPTPSRFGRAFSSFTTAVSSLPGASSIRMPDQAATEAYFSHHAANASASRLKKVLGWKELIGLGVGCTIGAGIFVVTGLVAATKAGPALFLCYLVSGFACCLAGLCYAELAAMAPAAGSAYSYARASLGQTMGWVIGWDLTLEYAVSAASVAQGWSKYFNALLKLMGGYVPDAIAQAPWEYDAETGNFYSTGSAFDLPALLITLVITLILCKGIRESAKFATAMVVLKVGIVLFVIIAGSFYMKAENFTPFMPYGFLGISFFGYTAFGQTGPDGNAVGVFAGAAIVFFAYIGFDSVTCQAEECKNAQRDLPIGIIGSLAISTVLYVAVSLVLVGMVSYTNIDTEAPLSEAFGQLGLHWAEFIIAVGALVGITSVLLVTLMGQPRILMSMARDGLLPMSFFGAVHPVYQTPYKSTLLTGGCVSLIASLIPLSVLVELVSIGTLLAFTIVCLSIVILRKSAPNVPRPFLCPFVPFVPLLGAFVCFMLMVSLPSTNWLRLIGWLGVGMLIYVFYGKANALKVMEERRALHATGAAYRSGGDRESEIESARRLEHVELAGGRLGLPSDSDEVSFGANEFALAHGDAEEELELHEPSSSSSSTAAAASVVGGNAGARTRSSNAGDHHSLPTSDPNPFLMQDHELITLDAADDDDDDGDGHHMGDGPVHMLSEHELRAGGGMDEQDLDTDLVREDVRNTRGQKKAHLAQSPPGPQ